MGWEFLQFDVMVCDVGLWLLDFMHHEEMPLQGRHGAEAQATLQALHRVVHGVAGDVPSELCPP